MIRAQGSATTWQLAGNDPTNSRNQPAENTIGRSNLGMLAPKWTFNTQGDISATPTLDSTAVYVPGRQSVRHQSNHRPGRLVARGRAI